MATKKPAIKPLDEIKRILKRFKLMSGPASYNEERVEKQVCIMQMVNLLNGEHRDDTEDSWGDDEEESKGALIDHPPCVASWLADLAIITNDNAFGDELQKLKSMAPRFLNTAKLRKAEQLAMKYQILNYVYLDPAYRTSSTGRTSSTLR